MSDETDRGPAQPDTPAQTIRICSFCREPMNEGATVCKTCGRAQPRSPQDRRALYLKVGAAAAGAALVLFIGFEVYQGMAEERMIQRIAECSRMHGRNESADLIRFELEDERQPGVSFDQAAEYMLITAGCSP